MAITNLVCLLALHKDNTLFLDDGVKQNHWINIQPAGNT
jgi:hypothetical protein